MKFAALLLAAVLTACGGGGGASTTGIITPAPVPRTDLLFGYYAGVAAYAVETQDHTNLFWAWAGGATDQMAALTQAKGTATVVALPFCLMPAEQGESEARTWFGRLHAAGLLDGAVAVYWCDEPDTKRSGSWTDAAATAMNAAVRRAMAGFPELAAARLAVIYACDTGSQPGLASYDWIGCDHYPSGCGVLSKYIEPIRAKLTKAQRLILVPGGADPWRQDPACFESYADSHPEVVAIVPFVWQTVTDEGVTYTGIRENPTKALYVATGKRIKG